MKNEGEDDEQRSVKIGFGDNQIKSGKQDTGTDEWSFIRHENLPFVTLTLPKKGWCVNASDPNSKNEDEMTYGGLVK